MPVQPPLYVTKAERKAEVEPQPLADDAGRIAVALERQRLHQRRLPRPRGGPPGRTVPVRLTAPSATGAQHFLNAATSLLAHQGSWRKCP